MEQPEVNQLGPRPKTKISFYEDNQKNIVIEAKQITRLIEAKQRSRQVQDCPHSAPGRKL